MSETYTKSIAIEKKCQMSVAAVRETSILLTLKHDNIIKATAVSLVGNKVKIDMKKYAYLDVTDVKNDTQFMAECLDALSYIHSVGIIYCDIKDDNILMDGDHPIFIDFGSACLSQSDMKCENTTLQYAAPEMILTPASDVWSLGIVFLMIHLKMNWKKMFNDNFLEDVLSLIPKVTNVMIREMLQVNPVKRWTAKQCLQHMKLTPVAYSIPEKRTVRQLFLTKVSSHPSLKDEISIEYLEKILYKDGCHVMAKDASCHIYSVYKRMGFNLLS